MVTLEAVWSFPLRSWLIACSFYANRRRAHSQKFVMGNTYPVMSLEPFERRWEREKRKRKEEWKHTSMNAPSASLLHLTRGCQ